MRPAPAWPWTTCWPASRCASPPNVKPPAGGQYPLWNWQNNESFRSLHPGGLHFACADGSVHFLSDDIALPLYRALATIRGGEAVTVP